MQFKGACTPIHEKRNEPEELTQLERLRTRLPTDHPQYGTVSKKYHQAKAGYTGELYVDRVLNEIAFPQGTTILKDITLEINPDFLIQIDTFIISPSIAFLLEIKNFTGTVHFDENSGKTTKISPYGETEKYDCVIHQLDRAAIGLTEWLRQRNINIPIEPILIMANNNTEIPKFPNAVTLKYAKQLPRYIRKFISDEPKLTAKQIRQITQIINQNRRKWWNDRACKRYKISPNELKRGVLCPTCNEPATRVRGHSWYCRSCKKNTKDALQQSIDDWFLLVSPTITNRQLRLFLDLKSSSAASVILRQTNLRRHGASRNTTYTKP
ncbi:nuclease-related domain-containing protein [Sporosarcina sp. 179-K 8C2 HS]|uniref:nuclease-related domain-containing protein n=1 Tax=Sporosarcina sp. 179-K 8C2 HS TaxID=3142387 RepID=UPI00399F891C